jgi:NDMA-dependent alcohol dehydrogenase
MLTTAAVLRGVGQKWEIVELELDEPGPDELLIRVVASGMCHSDLHFATGGIPPPIWPICAGHEGAAIVEKVGPNAAGWEKGDHLVLQFIPSCGKCAFCTAGQGNLCASGSRFMSGARADGSFRLHENGQPVAQCGGISTFANWSTVHVNSAVKISKDIPLESACLVGCGVATGFGSATRSANVQAGDIVVVMGTGGIGINAIQGAALQGAGHVIAVDPVAFKRESALRFGATHAFSSMDEAADFARSISDGQGADSAIICVGETRGTHIAEGFDAIRKGGTVVMTGVSDMAEKGIPISPTQMTLWQKRLQGSLYGQMSPQRDIPRLLDLYQVGKLRLDELVTRTYGLEDINQGWEDLEAGLNIRGVIIHEH